MDLSTLIGYFFSLFIGLSLGLVGSGGTILAIPILVYLFKIKNMPEATHYSMFVVGITAFVGVLKQKKKKLVDITDAVYFLIPSLLSLFFSRKIILPLIPDVLLKIGNFQLTKDIFLLLLFAIVILVVAIFMMKESQTEDVDCFEKLPIPHANHFKTSISAILVGVFMGLLGAGGGFLIVPTLIVWKKHCMRRAVGTSLVIITVNSFVGFISSLQTNLDWSFVLTFSTIAIVGLLLGLRLSEKVKGAMLKKMFGVIIFLLGIFIIIKELFL